MRLHPHGLSASQSPHLLMSHWMLGFQLRDLGRTQIIRLQKHLFILLLHAPIILQPNSSLTKQHIFNTWWLKSVILPIITANSLPFPLHLQSASELPDHYSAGFFLPIPRNTCLFLWPCTKLEPWMGHSLYVHTLGKFVKQIHIFTSVIFLLTSARNN